MMNSGMHKPPLAPKPKLEHRQRSGLSSPIPKREGLSCPSPGTQKRVKPALAPKPCLSKLTSAESNPPRSKSPHQTSASETPRAVSLLNSHNGVQQENKKPDWDYVIPICLCSQENCMCIRNTSTSRDQTDLKTLHKAKKEENRNTVPSSGHTLDNSKCPVINTSSSNTHLTNQKPLQETLTADRNLNTEVTVRPCLPHRTWSDEVNANVIPVPEEDVLGSEQTQNKPVPAAPKKPAPVPRKPRTAGQEKVEDREEAFNQKGGEINVKEAILSSEGKGSSSPSVSVPDSENKKPIFLSSPGSAPPAPPPRKKPFLSELEKVPTSVPQEDVEEENLGGHRSPAIEMSVDDEDEEMQKEGPDNLNLNQSPVSVEVAEVNGTLKVPPKKPQRHSRLMAMTQKEELSEEGEVGKPDDCVLNDRVMRELPLPPNSNRTLITSGLGKPSRSSLNKQKAKSFSTADIIRSDGPRRNSFRKLLDLKLSVKMLPKLIVKGGQSGSVHKNQEESPNFPEHFRAERKSSCPLIGVEQSVDGDEFDTGLQHYENISYYEEIPDYENVQVLKGGPASQDSFPQLPPWQDSLYNDDGIYEEQEPYMSLIRSPDLTPTPDNDSSVDEEVAPSIEATSDDDIVATTSNEEDEDDSSSVSSKGDHEQTEESTVQRGQKKSKIHHIATEIMTSESVFVDVLKLLHIDFRDSVSKASRQNGKPVIEERLLSRILYYLPQLYELNKNLLIELKQRLATWDENAQLADIFLKKGPYLKMYSTYIREFDKNVALLEEQSKKNPAFGAVVREFEASPRCANLALKHYLLKPVQRIPQYQLLLTDYLKNLSENSDDYKDTQAALALVKEVANHANDIMKQGDNFQKLMQVQCRLIGHHEIVQPGRVFLKEGVLMKLSRKVMQPRMFFLCNDILLYTTPVQGQYKLNNMLSLAGMKVSKPSQEANQNELNIESVERSFILSASSATERDEWLEVISAAISDYIKKKITFISGKPPDEGELGTDDDGAPLGSKAPIWIPDPRTTMCMICTSKFTRTWRRHHCRACGKVVCQSCSSNKHGLEYLKNQLARVCDQCFIVLQQQKNERALTSAVSPGGRATFAFSRRQKKIPAALKEVSASTNTSSMSGYLQRSKGNKKQWKRLWFVIKDKVLYTYAASEDVAALESQPLLGFVLNDSQKLQFKLYHKKTLYYIFKADDIQTAQRWIESFKEATVL
ncbi:FYVE, RhoGEF and PH domain-containing protein 6-like isoform X2 [Parambassis ranga]|uniref:FYVE, RhoGEF and PH domain-containing protein 6-like isoform X2 n=1 Tax=Parambassis ranga TaxID=210632 RepID=A0A6P7KDP3_9TELE|nr:FYVE, RhoGEF and PH domain-containing protein 6-like isoform X2 [Parambassis ranga]